MPEVVEASVQMTEKDLFKFMMYHAYSKIGGMLTLIFSLISLIMIPYAFIAWKDLFMAGVFLLVVIMYLVITPLNMYSQSKRQVQTNPVFKRPLTFYISEELLTIHQYTGEVKFTWEQIYKVKVTKSNYLFYMNLQQAFILPKEAVDEDDIELLHQIIDKVKEQTGKQVEEKSEILSAFKNMGGKKNTKIKKKENDLEARLVEMSKDIEKEKEEKGKEKNIKHKEKDIKKEDNGTKEKDIKFKKIEKSKKKESDVEESDVEQKENIDISVKHKKNKKRR